MGFRGIDVRESGGPLVVRASLKDSTGAKVTSGTATLRIFECQSNGTLHQMDFSDNIFKTNSIITPTQNMTHQAVGAYSSGLWTYSMASVGDFYKGAVYVTQVTHDTASPPDQEREWQYGMADGDPLFSADILFTRDQTNTQDEYTVIWYVDGVRITTNITVPTLQVVRRSDGTDLLAAATMTQIGSTGSYGINATGSNRQTLGEAVLVIATATIDGATRTWARAASRDGP